LIANQVKGTGFRGTLDYLLGKEEAAIIGGNMLGEDPKELASEFSVSRALRPKLSRVVYHASLSLPHDEHLSTSHWKEAANKYVQKMGFEGSQYVVVKHNDTKHEHIHIVASRVRLDGSVVSDSQDYKRSEKVVRGLEKDFGLTPTLSSHEVGKKALTKGELHKVLREKKPSIKMQLQQIIDGATEDRPNADIFATRLHEYGVKVIPNQSKTGHISGISFELNDETMKGSDLGRSYSWKNLTKRKLSDGKEEDTGKKESSRKQNGRGNVHKSNGENQTRSKDGYNSAAARKDHSGLLYRKISKYNKAHKPDPQFNKQQGVLPRSSEWKHGEQANITRNFCKLIGITEIKFHDLRATFITNALTQGASLPQIMSIVGHSRMSTTDEYLRLADINVKGVADKVSYTLPQETQNNVSSFCPPI
jgi:hypothetical protein